MASSTQALPSIQIVELSSSSAAETVTAATAILQSGGFPTVAQVWRDGQRVFIGVNSGHTVAVYATRPRDQFLQLTNIAVRADLRRQGYGTAMLKEVAKHRDMKVRATVMPTNRKVYREAGWVTDPEDNSTGLYMTPRR